MAGPLFRKDCFQTPNVPPPLHFGRTKRNPGLGLVGPQSPNSTNSSSTEYSMFGKVQRSNTGGYVMPHQLPSVSTFAGSPGVQRGHGWNLRTSPKNPVRRMNSLNTEWTRSRSLKPRHYEIVRRSRNGQANAILTPRPCRQFDLRGDSDYETPERVRERTLRLSQSCYHPNERPRLWQGESVRSGGSEIANKHRGLSADANHHASPDHQRPISPKSFSSWRQCATSRAVDAPPDRRGRLERLQTPHLALVGENSQATDVYETEGPAVASSLLEALRELKVAEAEQLDRTQLVEARRITLFDLIAGKERRQRARSPPPVPPKPTRRTNRPHQEVTPGVRDELGMNSSHVKDPSSSSTIPKSVINLQPSMLFVAVPPPLPSPPKTALLRQIDFKGNHSQTAKIRDYNEHEIKADCVKPISENPFLKRDRCQTEIEDRCLPQRTRRTAKEMDVVTKEINTTESSVSPCLSGEGDGDKDEFEKTSTSSESMEWPKPDQITACPKSGQCSPDTPDECLHRPQRRGQCSQGSVRDDVIANRGLVRVSLVAAPKNPIPVENQSIAVDAASDTSSSQASTVFSYPWDLPPPHLQAERRPRDEANVQRVGGVADDDDNAVLNSTPSYSLAKWATLHKHISSAGGAMKSDCSSLSDDSALSEEANGGTLSRDGVGSKDAIEGPLLPSTGSTDVEEETRDFRNAQQQNPYAIVGEESNVYEKILNRAAPKNKQSPDLEAPSKPSHCNSGGTIKPYVYAEVKKSADVPFTNRLTSPPVPQHPLKSDREARLSSRTNDGHFYEIIDSNARETENVKPVNGTCPSSNSSPVLNEQTQDIRANQLRGAVSSSASNERGRHLERFICGLVNDKKSSFSKHVTKFVECALKQLEQPCASRLQHVRPLGQMSHNDFCPGSVLSIRQFMNGAPQYLQKVHKLGLKLAIEAECRELRGLQYFDVGGELEELAQWATLRPLHQKIIDNLERHGPGSISVRRAIRFADLVKNDHLNSPCLSKVDRADLVKQILKPIEQIFALLEGSFKPATKLDYLARIFRIIDEQIQNSTNQTQAQTKNARDALRIILYAMVFSLTRMLAFSRPDVDVSRVEVQQRYIEGLISPARLAANADACRRLTDLVCVLRYVDSFVRYPPPPDTMRFLITHQRNPNEAPTTWLDTEFFSSQTLNKLRRSFTDDIQAALARTPDTLIDSSMTRSMQTWEESLKCGSESFYECKSSIVVLAASEADHRLVPYNIPLRPSLTVRELCNLLALRQQIFDPKEFTLFFHSASGDLPLLDSLHLQRFLVQQGLSDAQSPNDEGLCSFSSCGSIDLIASPRPSTPKRSTFSRLFRRRKRVASTETNLFMTDTTSARQRKPSIDWSSADMPTAPFVLIYRRRSTEAVLYASDLFQSIPSSSKLI
uniref:Serine/arginine repetitive matrix protein 2 n=2 Tax=Mesocestoides corti TaxID=53468 RepID=A0A5K3FCR7_MESCO